MNKYAIETYAGIEKDRLQQILSNISNIKVGFIGDLCIDVYWVADMKKSVLSREVPHYPLPIIEERYSLGAGGNVLANIAALKPKEISAISVIGNDWRGMLVKKCLNDIDIDLSNIIEIEGSTTNAYCKPLRTGISEVIYEDPRLDFEAAPLPIQYEEQLVKSLYAMAKNADIICVSDQFANGCITAKVQEALESISNEGLLVIVDSRDRITTFKNVTLKPNEIESMKAASLLSNFDEKVYINEDISAYVEAAYIMKKKLNCDVSMTLGAKGNLQIYDNKAIHILPREIKGPIDFCGAGDSFLSAYTCAMAAGAKREEAGQIASMASEVTISKLNQTGTASWQEILQRYEDAYNK